jgi:hypothetical protein
MKVVVDKQLRGGIYYVRLIVGEFTDDERQRFEKFGVPILGILTGTPSQLPPERAIGPRVTIRPQPPVPPGRQAISLPITNIGDKFTAGFVNADEAKAYEDRIIDEIKQKMQWLRSQKDSFSSKEEVDI